MCILVSHSNDNRAFQTADGGNGFVRGKSWGVRIRRNERQCLNVLSARGLFEFVVRKLFPIQFRVKNCHGGAEFTGDNAKLIHVQILLSMFFEQEILDCLHIKRDHRLIVRLFEFPFFR